MKLIETIKPALQFLFLLIFGPIALVVLGADAYGIVIIENSR